MDQRDLKQQGAKAQLLRSYAGVTAVLASLVGLLVWIANGDAAPVTDSRALLIPVIVLVATTLVVLLLAAVVRNAAVWRGRASVVYYRAYRDERPEEWIERPARTYDNLLQLPSLFYLVCVLMLVTGAVDTVQVRLAWLFVATRLAHALIYILINAVPYRFAAFISGAIVLAVIWGRFAVAI